LTWLSAKPSPDQTATSHAPAWHAVTAIVAIAGGLLLFVLGSQVDSWALRIGSLGVTTSGIRKLQVVVFHHCAHGTVLVTSRSNAILGELISGLLLIKSFVAYKRDHVRHHSSKYLLSPHDETVQFLTSFAGLEPGLSKAQLWRRLLLNFLNPAFHLRWLADRVLSCFAADHARWQLVKILYWAALLSAVAYAHAWAGFLLGWIVPLTVCYNVSATLRLAAEHRWPSADLLRSRAADFVCDTTVAVFLGAPLPRATGWRRIYAWPAWLAQMFGHFLARVLVLVGDTPCHDFHHRRPASRDWANYIFARQADFDRGCPGYARNYTAVWGLVRAIDENFASLSAVAQSSLPRERRRLPILWRS
jgi:Fatty acid desaturase